MEKINKNTVNVPKNEMLEIFCTDTLSISEAFLTVAGQIFDEETLVSLREYGEILRGIHNRLVSEGYVINNGKIYKK